MSYFEFYMCVANVLVGIFASYYHSRAKRLQHERDLARDYAARLDRLYALALQRLDQRLHLFNHEPEPDDFIVRKYSILTTNGYTRDGSYVLVNIASDRPHVLRTAMEAIVVNVSPDQTVTNH